MIGGRGAQRTCFLSSYEGSESIVIRSVDKLPTTPGGCSWRVRLVALATLSACPMERSGGTSETNDFIDASTTKKESFSYSSVKYKGSNRPWRVSLAFAHCRTILQFFLLILIQIGDNLILVLFNVI